jgi:Uncharacterized protein conserved in bacteria (DUF2188)
LQSGLAKSPCRGFATRNLAGVGNRRRRFFLRLPASSRPERGVGRRVRRATYHGKGDRIMLGRHVYRVHSTDAGWTVTKEGEDRPRASFAGREEAIAEAVRLAGRDEPAKVTVDNGDGTISEEWLFGSDPLEALGD